MTGLLLRRLLQVPLLLWCVFTATFFLLRIVPGGPLDTERELPPEIREAVRRRWRLDEPLPVQYVRQLREVFLEADLGPSLTYRDRSVGDILRETLPRSAALGSAALLFALLLGVPLGVIAARRRRDRVGFALSALFALGLSLPNFVLATLLVLVFCFLLPWFPVAGFDSLRHLVLPTIALGIPLAASAARLVRSGVSEALESPFLRTARAKGLGPARSLYGHALRAGLTPLVSWLGPAAAAVLTGSLVIEKIFAIPGMGTFFVTSVTNRDYTLATGVLLVYFLVVCSLNALSDAALLLLDPRLEERT